jgi:hypothetical protein
MNRPVSQTLHPFPDKPAPSAIPAVPSLQDCIARYRSALADIGKQLQGLAEGAKLLDALIALYEQCYPVLEQAMWSGEADFHALLASYQALFREQEALIRQRGHNDRHRFIPPQGLP